MAFKTISVIGLGYIGLPTAAVLASRGLRVIGVEINPAVVDTINQGQIHIVEPDLDILVQSVVKTGYLTASLTPQPADAFIIAVPTPFKAGNKPDLSYVESATRSIASVLKKGDLIILESTSPVGTTEQVSLWLQQQRPDLNFPTPHSDNETSDIFIAYCPERVLPGHILRELVNNDRVIGGLTLACANKAVDLYRTFVEGECIVTYAATAEMTKLTENSFRDVNIAFANELSIICDKLNIDVWELIQLANRHPRVAILQPGAGVGGHCIAVDPWFIVDSAPEQAKLIKQAREVNDSKPDWVINKVIDAVKSINNHPVKIACLGLSFKADIDDLRESPALEIVKKLAEKQIAELLIVEPYIEKLPATLTQHDNAQLSELSYAIGLSDIVLVLVDHKPFKTIDSQLLHNKKIIDTRGILK